MPRAKARDRVRVSVNVRAGLSIVQVLVLGLV